MQGLLETIQKNIEFVGISILLMVIVFAVARGGEILIEKKTGVRFTSEKTNNPPSVHIDFPEILFL